MTAKFDPIDKREGNVLTFKFDLGLFGAETLVLSSATVVVDRGEDPTATSILGVPQISGKSVLLPVTNLKDNVDYHITVTCTTSNPDKTLVAAGVLPVRIE
jgi:hypothetical protein